MRRYVALAVWLVLAPALAAAAVVERVAPVADVGLLSPVPVLSPAVAPSLSASFAPALLPSLPAPTAALNPVATPVAAVAASPLAAPAAQPHVRGPPTARDEEFGAAVSHSVSAKAAEWSVPAAEILEEHDTILVGENHGSLASVLELTKALPGLAEAGVKVLGIEGLKRPSQDAVDAYTSGRSGVLPPEVLAFSPRRRTAFEALFRTARETGVRVIALGVPLEQWVRQTAELAAAKTGDSMESFLGAPGDQLYRAQTRYEPGYNEAVAEVYLTRRNQSMAVFLAGAMVRGAKAVVLVGQNHVESADGLPFKFLGKPDWGSMPRELARLGLKAFSLTLTGGVYADAQDAADDREVRRASYAQAAEISRNGKPAYARTGASTGLYHSGGTVPAGASRARR